MTRRIRVASIIAGMAFGGSENRLLSFARTIDRSRFEHVVITLYCKDADYDLNSGSWRKDYELEDIELIDLGERPRIRLVGSMRPDALVHSAATVARIVRKLTTLLRERQIDIVDAQHATASLFGVMAARLVGIPATLTEYYPDYWDRPLMSPLGRTVYRMADAFICDAKAQSDKINAWAGRVHPRTVIVQNGIPTPAAKLGREEMRRRLEIPDRPEVRVVGQVGRLVPQKGQRELLRAAKRVLAQAPETYFVITGHASEDPTYLPKLLEDVRTLGIADRVRIVAWPGAIGDIWSMLDVHAHAALSDSLPISITEGMSWSRPAVVTRVGGIPEMVEHERTGLLVPPNDPEAMAASILRLLREPGLAAELGQAARMRYEERHQPAVMTRALERLFAEIVHERGRLEGNGEGRGLQGSGGAHGAQASN